MTTEIDANLKKAAQLQRDGELLLAKELYVAQAEGIMKLIKETSDDKKFNAALKTQLKQVLQKVSHRFLLIFCNCILNYNQYFLGRNFEIAD